MTEPTDQDRELFAAVRCPLFTPDACVRCVAAYRADIEQKYAAEVERLKRELAEAKSYPLADEERRKLTGYALQAEGELAEARATIEQLKAEHRKEIRELEREHQRDLRECAAQAAFDAREDERGGW